uniref:Phosphoprotein n=1 Tax=Duck rhabdovirus TaxID=2212761 RepID=A0A3G1RP91_9RHAB|nr:MAG: phosphoprotein [Duck rhabdovirus]
MKKMAGLVKRIGYNLNKIRGAMDLDPLEEKVDNVQVLPPPDLNPEEKAIFEQTTGVKLEEETRPPTTMSSQEFKKEISSDEEIVERGPTISRAESIVVEKRLDDLSVNPSEIGSAREDLASPPPITREGSPAVLTRQSSPQTLSGMYFTAQDTLLQTTPSTQIRINHSTKTVISDVPEFVLDRTEFLTYQRKLLEAIGYQFEIRGQTESPTGWYRIMKLLKAGFILRGPRKPLTITLEKAPQLNVDPAKIPFDCPQDDQEAVILLCKHTKIWYFVQSQW